MISVRLLSLMIVFGLALGEAVPARPSPRIFTISPAPGGFTVNFPAGLAAMSTRGNLGAIGLNWFNPGRGESESLAALLDLRRGNLLWSRGYRNSNCCGEPLIRLSPGGARLLAAGDEVVLWDKAGKVLSRTSLPEGKVSIAAEVSADGRWGMVVTSNGLLLLLSMRTGAGVWEEGAKGPTSLALSALGDVIALGTLNGIVVLDRSRRGMRLLWPGTYRWMAVALSQDGSRLAAAWKLPDGMVVAGAFWSAGELRGPLWARALWRGTVPIVKEDALGQAILVGDALGRGAAVLSWEGRVLWRSPLTQEGVHADLSSDGKHFVLASGMKVEVRRLPEGSVQWQWLIPGVALKARLHWPWVIVLGTGAQDSLVPDRAWLLRADPKHRI